MELSYWVTFYKKNTTDKVAEFLVLGTLDGEGRLRVQRSNQMDQFLSTLTEEMYVQHERAWEEIEELPVLDAIPNEMENNDV